MSLNNDKSSRSVWLDEGTKLLLSAMSTRWDIGDWALRTPAEASRDEVRELLEEAAARTGYEVNSIRDLRTVAERIPPPLRNRNVSWYAHKEISKLVAKREDGKQDEDESLALRSEFINKFAESAKAGVLEIRSAVRAKMGTDAGESGESETVSFKLTTEEHSRLSAIVEADPVHETVPDLVQELVRKFISCRMEVSQ